MRVAFSGKFGSGKDTAAEVIKRESSEGVAHFLFAKRVKEVVATLTGTTYEWNCTKEGKESIPHGFTQTLGQLQQIVGQTFREKMGEDVWANIVLSQPLAGISAVLTDLRYPNEANALRRAGFRLVRINVDEQILAERTRGDKRQRDHPSETALDNYDGFDIIIENNGTKEEFEEIVRNKILKR